MTSPAQREPAPLPCDTPAISVAAAPAPLDPTLASRPQLISHQPPCSSRGLGSPQGGAAYGFDPILTWTGPVEGLGCLDVQSNATGQMTCAFWADRPFNISFCSNTSWVPW